MIDMIITEYLDQRHIIHNEIHHLLNCSFNLIILVILINTIKFARYVNSKSSIFERYYIFSYFSSSYFSDGRLRHSFAIYDMSKKSVFSCHAFFRRDCNRTPASIAAVHSHVTIGLVHSQVVSIQFINSTILLNVILNYRATTFYHVHYPALKKCFYEIVRCIFDFYLL